MESVKSIKPDEVRALKLSLKLLITLFRFSQSHMTTSYHPYLKSGLV